MKSANISHRPIVFVDVETTGLSAREGKIIELGMVRVEDMKITRTYEQLFDPGVDVPWVITRVTGITNDDVWGKPQFASQASEIESFLEGAYFAAHNVQFDYSFMQEEFKRVGSRLISDRFCTVRLSKRLNPNERGHSLQKIIERHKYRADRRHRALDDAHVIAQFFIDHASRDFTATFRELQSIILKTTSKPAKADSAPLL